MAFDKQKDISTYSSGYGGGYGAYGWGWGGGWAGGTTTTQVRDILIGTLVIDLADAKKGELAWRGMGVKEVDTKAKPEKRDKSINNAVKKIFKNYPPKSEDVTPVATDDRRPTAWFDQCSRRHGLVMLLAVTGAARRRGRSTTARRRTLNLSAYAELLRATSARRRSRSSRR